MLGISWIWWALGTFGTVGTLLLLWLAPATLAMVVKSVLTFFLTNRYGNMIAVGLIVFFVADVNRSLRDQHEFAARTAAFEQSQRDRDTRIAQETRDQVWKDIANQTAENTATDKDVKEFHDALPAVPFANGVNPFRVGDASCKLRHVAGQAGCGPARAKGVPKARPEGAVPGNQPRFRLPGFITGGIGGAQKGQ